MRPFSYINLNVDRLSVKLRNTARLLQLRRATRKMRLLFPELKRDLEDQR